MTTGVDIVHDVLDVAYVEGGAWDNYGSKPTNIVKVGFEDLFDTLKEGEYGIKIANATTIEQSKDHHSRVLTRKWNVILSISAETEDDRDNLYQDCLDLFVDTDIYPGDDLDPEDLGSGDMARTFRYTLSLEVFQSGSII